VRPSARIVSSRSTRAQAARRRSSSRQRSLSNPDDDVDPEAVRGRAQVTLDELRIEGTDEIGMPARLNLD
jgi:hypothetical protein